MRTSTLVEGERERERERKRIKQLITLFLTEFPFTGTFVLYEEGKL